MSSINKKKEQQLKGYASKICKHISRVMGDDKRSRAIISEIQEWTLKSGPIWTIERLRSLKQGVLDYISSQDAQVQGKFKLSQDKNWIKTDRDGWPKGQLGSYLKEQLRHSNGTLDVKLRRVLSVLNASRAIKAKQILPFQRDKYIEAITGKPGRDDIFEFSYKLGLEASRKAVTANYKSLFEIGYDEKFSFSALNTSKTLTSFLPQNLRTKENGWILSLLEQSVLNSPYNPILEKMGLPIKSGPKPDNICAGVIKVIQEGGFKARVVAMPNAGAQVAFRPLHKALGNILKHMPQDCTFNQMKGVEWGAEQLRLGKTMYAVDLSSATDNFPLGFQKAVLESLEYEYSDNFIKTCQMKWGYKDEAFSKLVTYTKGQPMGLYGSFVLFSFSHHIVLQAIEAKVNKRDTYRILGDDIIINDKSVYENYLHFMRTVHVPISTSKCLISDFYTEFAGKLISPEGKIPIVKGPKSLLAYGCVDTNQYLNYCEVSGKIDNIIHSVPKEFRNYAKALVQLPEYFGGLGFNPEGLSWVDRITKFSTTIKAGLPEYRDLSTQLVSLSFKTEDKHAKDILNFINDQLIEVRTEIRGKLRNTIFEGISRNTNLERVLLQQAIEADNAQDGSLSFVGTVAGNRNKLKTKPKAVWKRRQEAIARFVNNKFDNLAKREPDLSKIDTKLLSQKSEAYEPWMSL